ncbi:MAG: BrnA antitoxin family protein [Rickettsiales bacterium]|nr:BrnA antitoxin family protein [Rickettsiales bacterium]
MAITRTTLTNARAYTKAHRAELNAKYAAAPAVDDGFADWAEKNDIKPVARGFAAFKEYINRNGRPKLEDPKVSISIRIPLSYAASMRATGPGWQTRMSEYIVRGIKRGELRPAA